MGESTIAKIIRKTGRKPTFCKCVNCKNQCLTCSCLGTPDDIEKIIDAGYGDSIMPTDWAAGIVMGVTKDVIEMYQLKFTKTGCIMFENGLCKLHDKGLKPTEGKLSHHTHKIDTFNAKKSLSWAVAKEWLRPENKETIMRIELKLKK